MVKQDQKGYVLTIAEQIKGLEHLIAHLILKTGNKLSMEHPYMKQMVKLRKQ
tara:strand:+ start:734 stop:889 length:156 start_codon:yes stop_codon:yes gene_type:complete